MKYLERITIMAKTPALFIGHGLPTNAIEDNSITCSWQKLGQTLP